MKPETSVIRRKIRGVALRQARLAQGRSLEDCAGVIHASVEEVAQIERGARDLTLPELETLFRTYGETGTGKTLVAHALHAVRPRAARKFVTFSCAASADDQLAPPLFGPAEDGTIPPVDDARGGAPCLDDIESLSQTLQARLPLKRA